MKFSKTLCAVLVLGTALFAAAADLTLDLQIKRGAPVDYNPQIRKTTVAVFVIDCSGSMKEKFVDQETRQGFKNWSRVQLVAEKLLPERFEALPKDAQVCAYLYSVTNGNCRSGKWLTEMRKTLDTPASKAQFLKELQRAVYARVDERGATPYYDTMEKVLIGIRKAGWLNDPKINLELYDYTDGENATNGFEGDFFYQSHVEAESYKADLARLARRFDAIWGDCLKQIAKKGFYEQLNVGTKQERPDVKHIPAYKVVFSCGKTALKSPRDAAAQKVPLYVSFPVNQESWDLLKQAQGKLRVQFGAGALREFPVAVGKPVSSVKVPVPAEAMRQATKVTVSFDSPKGVPGKFTLAAPAPVSFVLPRPKPPVRSEAVAPRRAEQTGRGEAVGGMN